MNDTTQVRPIDARAAIEKLQEYVTEMEADIYYDSAMGIPKDDIEDAINEVPTLEVTPVVHAAWLISTDGYYPYCTNCLKEPTGRATSDYCPNCGAIMDGDGLKIRAKSETYRIHANWEKKEYIDESGGFNREYTCSNCGGQGVDWLKYCPHCGAKMDNGGKKDLGVYATGRR